MSTAHAKARSRNCKKNAMFRRRVGSDADGAEVGELGDTKFAYHGQKMAEIEAGTARRAPSSSEPPPPIPPRTFSSDKAMGKRAKKERRGRRKSRLKREWARRKGRNRQR